MDDYNTTRVTRSKAKQKLVEWLVSEASDKMLQDLMNEFVASGVDVVPDGAANDDDAI
jgi:hypothetical protein